ncbi:hypothetical protein [Mucilaginibacter pedocola]|uniref:PA14 domain-containing protein n=1 Tax=Mucilaginibacter pedocola TaxID=1792845 RepID=A0A1S9PKR4_9SPHI|nr:hypothetical protein [Mucilaginibacter pedocola]OOQ61537.1 hypothetical protein BC343_00200 [Mucilaginibacter pedocola]
MNAKLLFLFLLISSLLRLNARAAKVPAFDHLPPGGIDIIEGWRFTGEDGAGFAAPEYNDKSWRIIHPEKPLSQLPELKGVSIGWMRTHFTVGPELSKRSLILSVFQTCASEIFLDGELILRHGVISRSGNEVIPIGANLPEEELHLSAGKEHVLAIRFAPWRPGFHMHTDGYLLWLTLNNFSNWQANNKAIDESNGTYTVLVSVFFF